MDREKSFTTTLFGRIKMAMVQMDTALKDHFMQTQMLLTVHDELVFEVPEDETQKAAPLRGTAFCVSSSGCSSFYHCGSGLGG
ncbi:DNA polymerase [Desulfobotulus alkaliphilus]|uniref:DNA polymerase n=1 Tax=Desulfobotulus alkaliphilus TaxID=622671 RepID=UPI001646D23C|nr:DNA polymerase [Desulfobotulus alkaliphilus]